jgi:hypothetical protein
MVKIAAGAKGSRYAGDDSGETNLTCGFHSKGPSFAPNGRALMFSATPRQRRTFACRGRQSLPSMLIYRADFPALNRKQFSGNDVPSERLHLREVKLRTPEKDVRVTNAIGRSEKAKQPG